MGLRYNKYKKIDLQIIDTKAYLIQSSLSLSLSLSLSIYIYIYIYIYIVEPQLSNIIHSKIMFENWNNANWGTRCLTNRLW